MFIGRSPLVIAQFTVAKSPEFVGSSPNSKGRICGGTRFKGKQNLCKTLLNGELL